MLLFSHQVFRKLEKATPRDLISKELRANSPTAADWFQVQQGYINSMAVTTMVGHIIGLGDRHLDNMLLDPSSGEIIHIDYNICFDKGRELTVPELVPYRLTPIFVHALGLGGTEGGFRPLCEQILRWLRGSSELLLTLLEAFVYDPLVR